MSDKQKNIISRYINSIEVELPDLPLVQFMECQKSDKFNNLNEEFDGWYRRLAVSETRMNQFMETYEHIRVCLKQDEKYLFTGSYFNESESVTKEWDMLIYGSVQNGLCQEKDSDLDLTLVVNDFEIPHEVLLRRIRAILQRDSRFYQIAEPYSI